MPWYEWAAVALAATILIFAGTAIALALTGRRGAARALVTLIPDCVVLARRLLADPRLPRRRKVVLIMMLAYLALPFDLVPDFIPVLGQLDDAIIVAVSLRFVLRGAGPHLVGEHWPGPPESLGVLQRLVTSSDAVA